MHVCAHGMAFRPVRLLVLMPFMTVFALTAEEVASQIIARGSSLSSQKSLNATNNNGSFVIINYFKLFSQKKIAPKLLQGFFLIIEAELFQFFYPQTVYPFFSFSQTYS